METDAIHEIKPLQSRAFDEQQIDKDDSHCSEACNRSYLQSMEATIKELRKELKEAHDQIYRLEVRKRESTQEKESLLERANQLDASFRNTQIEYERKLNEEASQNEELNKEVSFLKHLVERLESELENVEGRNGSLLRIFNSLNPAKESLQRIVNELEVDNEDPNLENPSDDDGTLLEDEDVRQLLKEIKIIRRLAREAEERVKRFKEAKEKEKIDLQRSVVSLTEENRDTSTLFRVALMEKENVEKKMREGNTDQKKAALLQIYERGLRGVGFGFIVGGGDQDSLASNTVPSSSASTKSEVSDHEEEGDNLGSIVERMMKNLRSEILQLRSSLAESRSDNERMQTLARKQSHELTTTMEYISELEEKETTLIQNIEGLELEIKEAEAEAARWREACESEVKAGKREIEEREKVVSILKGELERTKSALEIANGRVQLKEELAEAAMEAQEAAERSLQLADGRSAELRQRIEVLTKEIEEMESRRRRLHWTRQICLPWQLLRYESLPDANARIPSTRFLPRLPQGTP